MLNSVPVKLPPKAVSYLMSGLKKGDIAAARRLHLLELLWRERYLSPASLVWRVETIMGSACFGNKCWKDNFYRDMRGLKAALRRSGYALKYSRKLQRPGYYLVGEPALHPDVEKAVRAALRELDPLQIEIYKRMSPAQKFVQACSITDLAREVAAARRGS